MAKLGVYYVIRHKATGEVMPQAFKNRGYSHWNPSTGKEFSQAMPIPRLIDTRRTAVRCIDMWVANPNAQRSISTSYYGETDDIVDISPDGRKKEDLEVVEVLLTVKD